MKNTFKSAKFFLAASALLVSVSVYAQSGADTGNEIGLPTNGTEADSSAGTDSDQRGIQKALELGSCSSCSKYRSGSRLGKLIEPTSIPGGSNKPQDSKQ